MSQNKESFEVNFDGLVGNTHSYAGLSFGNTASTNHKALVSNPKQAALQGLKKMLHLSRWGLKQAVLAPQQRPDFQELRKHGYSGKEEEVIARVFREAPELLSVCYSASSMWTANAATVAPSQDTEDGKLHIIPANLREKAHRAIEPQTTKNILKAVFKDENQFIVHEPLASDGLFGDEGAANHTRLCKTHSDSGLHLFVYGIEGSNPKGVSPQKFPARQTLEASKEVSRLNRLKRSHSLFIQQNPKAIDAGAFHNDVVSVGNENVFMYHEEAFLNSERDVAQIKEKYYEISGEQLHLIPVLSKNVSLDHAVKSYLFNSQIVSFEPDEMLLVAPSECKEIKPVFEEIKRILEDSSHPLSEVQFFDLRQSMQNGGGPACLRLRVVLTEDELGKINPEVIITPEKYDQLVAWVNRHYRDRLSAEDLADPMLWRENLESLDELTQILNLGSVYPFQLK